MCTIKVSTILARTKDYRKAGEELYCIMIDKIQQGEPVKLDMSDIEAIPSLLLNPCVGRFIDNYGLDKLRETLSFSNILKSQAIRFKDYIQHYQPINQS